MRRIRKRAKSTTPLTKPQEGEAILTVSFMRELFNGCDDVKFYDIETDVGLFTAITCEGLYDVDMLFDKILTPLQDLQADSQTLHQELKRVFKQNSLYFQSPIQTEYIINAVFTGNVMILHENSHSIWELEVASHPKRQIQEPSTEVSIRGSKEGFVEEANTNLALVRKRIRSTSLKVVTYELGERTKTTVLLLYIEDITNKQIVEEAQSRLKNIHVDGIVSNVTIEEYLGDNKKSLFPLFNYSGRPDFVVDSLLRGRFAVIVDGSPNVLLAPANFLFVMKTAEDAHVSPIFVAFERILRYTGFYAALFLPAFWIALITYHPDQLPFTLLATVALSREGVPLSAPLECFLMLLLFEIFREAGIRLPMAVGQILSVVGGIIIGQAAISAGFTAPGILVMNAISLVSTFTLVNQSLVGIVGILRIVFLIVTSLLGMFGFFLCVFATIAYLANLRSFGVPYLAPLSPTRPIELFKSITNPDNAQPSRPGMLHTKDSSRKRGN